MSTPFYKEKSTSFWQIRNRSFLKQKLPSQDGDMAMSLGDLNRDMIDISFNGKTLLSILMQKTGGNLHASQKDQVKFVKRHATEQDLSEVFKEELLAFCQDEEQKEKYAAQLGKVFYQNGLLYATAQALKSNHNAALKGYFVNTAGLSTRINIYSKGNRIYVEEKVNVMSLQCPLLQCSDAEETPKFANADNTPLMIMKNKFHMKAIDGDLAYKHTDLTIHYNNPVAKNLFDQRGVFAKIRDFIKSLLRMNDIKEFTLDKEPANYNSLGPCAK